MLKKIIIPVVLIVFIFLVAGMFAIQTSNSVSAATYMTNETPAPITDLIYNAFSRLSVRNSPSLSSTSLASVSPGIDYAVTEQKYVNGMNESWACVIYKANKPCGWVPVYIGDRTYGQIKFNLLVITADPTLGYPYDGWDIIK